MDLINSETINQEFVLKHYSIDPEITQDQFELGVFPIIADNLKLLKNKLDKGQSFSITNDRDNQLKDEFNLNFNKKDGSVYFLLIEGDISLPF